MKKLTSLYAVILVGFFTFAFIACNNGTTGNFGKPNVANFSNAKALFIGSSQGRSARNVIISDNILYKINSSGDIAPVEFKDEDGNVLQAQVSGLSKKSKNFLGFWLSVGSVNYPILAEASTGRLFIMENVDIRYCISEILGTRYIVYNPMNTGAVYKLDLDSLIARPLNNPAVDSFYGYFWYFDNQQNAVFALPYPGNKIIVNDISSGSYILDLDAIIPPQKITGDYIYGYPLNTGYGLDISNKLPIFAAQGAFYSFETSSNNINVYLNGSFIETLNGASISSGNEMLNTNVHFAYDTDDMYIYKSGILLMSQGNDGTIDYEYQPKNLEYLFEADASFYYKNGTVYCHSGNSFKKADPLNNNAYSVIYTHPTAVRKSWMMDENIYFTAYNTATSISTYAINKGGTTPVEVSKSEMEVTSILELVF